MKIKKLKIFVIIFTVLSLFKFNKKSSFAFYFYSFKKYNQQNISATIYLNKNIPIKDKIYIKNNTKNFYLYLYSTDFSKLNCNANDPCIIKLTTFYVYSKRLKKVETTNIYINPYLNWHFLRSFNIYSLSKNTAIVKIRVEIFKNRQKLKINNQDYLDFYVYIQDVLRYRKSQK